MDMMVESFDSTESDDDRLLPLVGESFDALVSAPTLAVCNTVACAACAPCFPTCDVG
jgi:hypothetical protein